MSLGSGVGAMVKAGAWLEHQLEMEVLSIGRSVEDVEDCVMEVCGQWLGFRLALRGGWIFLSACVLDRPCVWDSLLSVADGEAGWRTICDLLRALERHQIKSLDRPIEAGLGPNGFIIG